MTQRVTYFGAFWHFFTPFTYVSSVAMCMDVVMLCVCVCGECRLQRR